MEFPVGRAAVSPCRRRHDIIHIDQLATHDIGIADGALRARPDYLPLIAARKCRRMPGRRHSIVAPTPRRCERSCFQLFPLTPTFYHACRRRRDISLPDDDAATTPRTRAAP